MPLSSPGLDPRLGNRLARAVMAERDFATAFFDRLRRDSVDPAGGITRDTYGPGETRAHRTMSEAAQDSGFEIYTDAAANTYARWAATQGDGRAVLIGSHLDSVPQGGNFDGAAGALAGLVVLRALSAARLIPRRDLVAMGIRAEESVWFEVSYIGSRAALGTLPDGVLDSARRVDTGRTLAEHMQASGADPDRLRDRTPAFAPERIAAFVELHIEQAPALLESGKALGICTGIPGNFRHPSAYILGEHQHVGTPRRFRHDAAMAAVALATGLDQAWATLEAEGVPAAVTFGRFHTDAAAHGMTKVPGLFHFSVDVRAYKPTVLDRLEAEFHAILRRVEAAHRVRVELGARASAPVGPMDPGIRDGFARAASARGIEHMMLGSPASHDAAAFAAAGVPVGMILIRNANGSHTPAEHMEIEDFMVACLVLADWLAAEHCHPQ